MNCKRDSQKTQEISRECGGQTVIAPKSVEKIRREVLSRHIDWVSGASITESLASNDNDTETPEIRRFTATVRGWNSFLISVSAIKQKK